MTAHFIVPVVSYKRVLRVYPKKIKASEAGLSGTHFNLSTKKVEEDGSL